MELAQYDLLFLSYGLKIYVQKHLDEINKSIMSKELGTCRAVAKVRKSCNKMTLSLIPIGPRFHQITSKLWDSTAIQNPYSFIR